jgi:group II intron reverse transcriptase/maturase
MSPKLQRIAQQAVDHPGMTFTTLAHLIDEDFLRAAFQRTRKDGAPGVDQLDGQTYAVDLDDRIRDLHHRLRAGQYRAPLVKRAWIAKENGKRRPLGLPTFEDKIVQRAVHSILNAIYEREFLDFSYGYREGRSAHQAVRELRERMVGLKATWIIDADISGFFDSINHRMLLAMIRQRINDGALLRLIGKWLKAGILEGGQITFPEEGTPQGGVISPLLANVFLHHVLDRWFVREVKPRMRGQCFLVRFADDFALGFTHEEDARRIMEVLPKRFGRFGLTIHPEKTRLVEFCPPSDGKSVGKRTFDFLGFTHYWGKPTWGKTARGSWFIKRRTASSRMRRATKAMWDWCHEVRHEPMGDQHRTLRQKLFGHFQYYGIRGNYQQMERFSWFAKKAWHYWLSRRSSRSYIRWDRFLALLQRLPLPPPRIIHQV